MARRRKLGPSPSQAALRNSQQKREASLALESQVGPDLPEYLATSEKVRGDREDREAKNNESAIPPSPKNVARENLPQAVERAIDADRQGHEGISGDGGMAEIQGP